MARTPHLQSVPEKGEVMADVDKRAFVAALYPGQGWKHKVAQMPESQVTAIYLREQAKAQSPHDTPKQDGQDDIPI